MATHSSILAWKIPRTEEPGGLQSTGSRRVRHDWACDTHLCWPGQAQWRCQVLQLHSQELLVNLREELKLTNVVFFPRCLLVQRWGGNCGCGTVNWKSCTCNSGKTVKKYHEVLKFEPGHFKRRGRAKHMALIDIQLDHHERCDCICSSRPPR